MPNPIAFFQALERLLTPGGIVSLVIPDKRYCFDFFRPHTTTAAWLEAYHANASRHSQRTMFEHVAYSAANRDRRSWNQEGASHLSLLFDVFQAKTAAAAAEPSGSAPYTDAHAWCFTPSSFELLIVELNAMGLIHFTPIKTFPTLGCEFFITLKRCYTPIAQDEELSARRISLLEATIHELAVQSVAIKDRWPLRAIAGTIALVADRLTDRYFWRRRLRSARRGFMASLVRPGRGHRH